MVLIVKKSQRKRCDFVFITIRVLKDMLDRHLHRKFLKPGVDTTCFVDETGEKIPTDDSVIRLLIDTLKNNLLREGEISYPFAPTVIKCRSYRPPNWAVTSPYDGAFRINLERINGWANAVLKHLEFERLNKTEIDKIRGAFRNAPEGCEKEFVFIARHFHPVRRAGLLSRLFNR